MGNGVTHVVGDHQGGEPVPLDDLLRGVQHFGRRLGVQGGGVLVQEEELGLDQAGHEEGEGLALSAGEEPHLGGEPVLQAQVQDLEELPVLLTFTGGDARLQAAGFAPPGGQSQVFLDLHGGGGAHHGVLEDPPDVLGPLVLGQVGDVDAVDGDGAGIHRPHPGHGIEQGGLAGAVAADDGDEIPVGQGEGDPVEGPLLIDGAGVKGLVDLFEFKHCAPPPFEPPW